MLRCYVHHGLLVFQRDLSFFSDFETKVQQHLVQNSFDVHQPESRANAVSWT